MKYLLKKKVETDIISGTVWKNMGIIEEKSNDVLKSEDEKNWTYGLYTGTSGKRKEKGDNNMYKIIARDGNAKRAEFQTVHGTIQTPVFMNVGTAAAIKGAVATTDLKEIGTQVELSNTYHLHVRPGLSLIHISEPTRPY